MPARRYLSRKQLSQVVVQDSPLSAGSYSYAAVTVGGTGEIDPIGTPVVFDDTAATFILYAGAAIGDDPSTLPNPNAQVGVTVGTSQGIGFNEGAVDLADSPVLWVAFRDAVVAKGGLTTAADAAFIGALESQGVSVIDSAVKAQPKLV